MNEETLASPSAAAADTPDQHASAAPATDDPSPAQENDVNAAAFAEAKPEGAQPPFPQEVSINDLQASSLAELQELADTVGFRLNASRSKHQLIYDLCSWLAEHRTRLKVEGVLEIGADNFGLIRYPKYSFTPLPEDVFVPLFLVRKFNLRASQRIAGFAKAPKDKDKYIAIDRITEVEGMPIDQWEPPADFDKLTATFPNQRIILETAKPCAVSSRILDLVAPLGKGQRGLICAPPRSGKTVILKDIAKSIAQNHKEVTLIVLLLDERPEEVTDFEETVQGCEIYSSTFDESPKRHSQVAEIVRERACRLVELKKDVVILIDSITRLARGYNASLSGGKGQGGGGGYGSGGLHPKALQKPKKFFGAARNVDEGGSLTIIATALVDTGSRMDDVIFEEFKGTGNTEIVLDRRLVDRRVWPAIDINRSGTRREELLLSEDELKLSWILRRTLNDLAPVEAMELLVTRLKKFNSNEDFLKSLEVVSQSASQL